MLPRAINPRRDAVAALLLMLLSCAFVTLRAVPIMRQGADDLRLVKLVLPDEERILSGVWQMVADGSLQHGIEVYPDLFPLILAGVRVAVGDQVDTATQVIAARSVSLVALWLAILVPGVLLFRFTGNPWLVALFSGLFAVHPEVIRWSAYVHPDTLLVLFDHAALVFLGLYARNERQRDLYAATALAALSAATKLVGFFLMLWTCGWIVWLNRRAWRDAVRLVIVQSAFFLLVFLLLNPQLFVEAAPQLEGWSQQNRSNRHAGGTRLDWLTMLAGPRGLGLSGLVVVGWGLVSVALRRVDRGLVAFGGFGAFFAAYLLASVTLVVPRYAFPAAWPLLLVGLCAIAADWRRHRRVVAAAVAALVVIFAAYDLPARVAHIRADRATFASLMSPDLLRLADYLRALERTSPGPLYSYPTATVYVPPEVVDWRPVWSADYVRPEARADGRSVVVIDPRLRQAGGAFYDDLVHGRAPFVRQKTIGPYDLYFGVRRRPPVEVGGAVD